MSRPAPAELARLPWREPGGERPDLPLPPVDMPLRSAGGWRKRWRYVGAFSEEWMVCAASVQIGLVGQSFWAILNRGSGELIERTRTRTPIARGEVWTHCRDEDETWELGGDKSGIATRVESEEVEVKLSIGEGAWAESICPNGEGSYVWTRKRATPIRCRLRLPGQDQIDVEMRGIEDESAGYHPRHTVWSWSAGVGTASDGRGVAWNLVEGVNDPPERSERAIWVEGEPPLEPAPVSFQGLDAITFAGGRRLEFTKEAERAKSENRLLIKYAYRQPFGTFTGSLDGIELAEGIGVMEHQDAVW